MTPKQIARQRRNIGMVFQRFNLFPHLTALENITEAPTGISGKPKAESKARGVADQAVFMDGGVVVEAGQPSDVLDNPQRERTRNFLESVR